MKVVVKNKVGSISLPLKEGEFFDLDSIQEVLIANSVKVKSAKNDALMPPSKLIFWLPSENQKISFNISVNGKITVFGNWKEKEINDYISELYFKLFKPCIKTRELI